SSRPVAPGRALIGPDTRLRRIASWCLPPQATAIILPEPSHCVFTQARSEAVDRVEWLSSARSGPLPIILNCRLSGHSIERSSDEEKACLLLAPSHAPCATVKLHRAAAQREVSRYVAEEPDEFGHAGVW